MCLSTTGTMAAVLSTGDAVSKFGQLQNLDMEELWLEIQSLFLVYLSMLDFF